MACKLTVNRHAYIALRPDWNGRELWPGAEWRISNSELVSCRTCGAPFTRYCSEFRTEKCPFRDLPEKRRTLYSLTRDEMQNYQWLKPVLVAQVEFQEWTPDGHLRHASFAGLRNDKDAGSIVRKD